MAVSTTVLHRAKVGTLTQVVAEVTFDATYPDNGESFVPADVSLTEFDLVLPSAAYDNAATELVNICVYDHTTKKLVLFDSGTTGVDFPQQATADQSLKKVRLLIFGRG